MFLWIGCFGFASLFIPRKDWIGHHLSSCGGIFEMFHSCRRPSRQLPLRLRWSIYWRRGGRQQPFILVLYTLYFIVRLLPNTLLAQRGAAFGSFYFYLLEVHPVHVLLCAPPFKLNTGLPQCSARITRTSLISQNAGFMATACPVSGHM